MSEKMKNTVTKGVFANLKPSKPKNAFETSVEVRENEEQNVKYQEIVDLLVAAGYFRARIKGLSAFDKVVGGIVWCMELCEQDVDVDFLFEENASIGQKIALTEKIVAQLPKMKCPHTIEPHQIQGLDFIHIFPVIQWLVKRCVARRDKVQEQMRTLAITQFDKTYTLPSDLERNERISTIQKRIDDVKQFYLPKRRYKLKQAYPDEEIERVLVTLLEYDQREHSVKNSGNESGKHLEGMPFGQEDVNVTKLLNDMTVTDDDTYEVLTTAEKSEMLRHFTILQEQIKAESSMTPQEKQLANLEEQRKNLTNKLAGLNKTKEKLTVTNVETNEKLTELGQMKEEAQRKLAQFDALGSDLEKMVELIAENEKLREEETQLKEHCKKEMMELEEQISALENEKIVEEDEDALKLSLHNHEQQLQTARLEMAKLNRALTYCHRKLDDVPTRAELTQYQRRLVEVNNQVSAKHKETKQYYSLYNTLEDTKMYMNKELSLLNSILDIYPQAIQTASGKEEFITQMQSIVENVQNTKMKVANRLAEQQKRREQLNDEMKTLFDLNRKYAQSVRQLSIECKKLEDLERKIQARI